MILKHQITINNVYDSFFANKAGKGNAITRLSFY